MKILFIVYSDLSFETGQKTHIKELIQNLEKNGNSITLICRKGYIEGLNVSKSYWYNYSKVNNFLGNLFKYLSSLILFFFRIVTNIKDADIIYFRNYKLGFFIAFLKRIFRKKTIFEANGLESLELQLSETNILIKTLSKIYKLTEMIALKDSDKIISVTENLKDIFMRKYRIEEKNIVVINNGVNIDLFKPMETKKAIADLKLNENNYYVCFTGYLTPWQGVEYLVKAAPLVSKAIPLTKFLIIGNGPMKKDLKNLISKTIASDKFIFTGMVPHEDVPKYINASDVCVAPFIRERNEKIGLSPLKIYEYAACGKPIITSIIPNLEFIEEFNTGIMVESCMPMKIASAIIELLKNPKLRLEMGENGREYVEKNHSWENIAEMVEKVCEDTIKQKNNGKII